MGYNNENKHAKLNYNTSSLLVDLFLIKIAFKLKGRRKYTLALKVNKTEVQRWSAESLTYIACNSLSLFLLNLHTSIQNMQVTNQVNTLQKACSLLQYKRKTISRHETQRLNLLKTKRRLLYLKTQPVPRNKHLPPRL